MSDETRHAIDALIRAYGVNPFSQLDGVEAAWERVVAAVRAECAAEAARAVTTYATAGRRP